MNTVKQMPRRKVVFIREIEKKHGWIIPIESMNGKYLTGQDLEYDKSIGKKPLTPDDEKKYPYVINPHNLYRIQNHKSIDLTNFYEKAIYDLMIISKKIAKSEIEYKQWPMKYIGYIYDAEEEARQIVSKEDNIYEAMQLVRDLPAEKYKGVILLLNYTIKSPFYVPVSGVSLDFQRAKLLEACREYPDKVKNCFQKYNPGIDQYMFILELIEYKVIRETQRGQYFYEKEPLGSSMEEVLSFLTKQDNSQLKKIFTHKLAIGKGEITDEKVSASPHDREGEFANKVRDLKSLIVDDDAKVFKNGYLNLLREYEDFCNTTKYLDDMQKLKDYMQKIALVEQRHELRGELNEKDIGTLHKSFGPKSVYQREDVDKIWDDKEKLIDYMVNKRYPNA